MVRDSKLVAAVCSIWLGWAADGVCQNWAAKQYHENFFILESIIGQQLI